jgi:hypothetical protein
MIGSRCTRLALLAGLLVGCDRSELDDPSLPDVDELSQRHACGDMILIAANAEASEGLFLTIDDGLVDEVIESGEFVSDQYRVGDAPIELRWVTGRNVYAGHCGLDNGEPWQVDTVEQAIAGEISVELEPSAEGPILTVELRDVLLSPLDLAQAKQEPEQELAQAHAHALPFFVLDGLRVMR